MSMIKSGADKIFSIFKLIFMISKELFILLLFANILSASLPFVNIIFSQKMIDAFIEEAVFGDLIIYAVGAIVVNVVLLTAKAILDKRQKSTSACFELQFEKKLSFHLAKLSVENISSNCVKELQRNIEQGKMRGIQPSVMIIKTDVLLKNIFSLLIAIVSLVQIFGRHQSVVEKSFWTSPWSLVMLLLIISLFVIVSFHMQLKRNERITELYRKANEANGGAFAYMQIISDSSFGKEIRCYKIKDFLCDSFNKLWKSSIGYNLLKRLGHEKALVPCIITFCNGILDILIYLFIIMKAIRGEVSIGTVVVYIESIRIFMQAIMSLVNTVVELLEYGELLNPYFQLLEIREEEKEGKIDAVLDKPWIIKFEHVSFRYPEAKQWVLRDINFSIEEGEHIAIVGVNGSGKSTLIKLLCRFYEPQEGRITWNGIDIRYIEIERYRQIFSSVFQDFSLPAFQLGNVIACREKYEKKRVIQAILNSGLAEMESIKLDTWLYRKYEGNGIEISGGEAQKIAVARAFFKDSPIIVMDEPTAAMDPRTEAEIYENIAQNITVQTLIFVSHRMSSCRVCKKVLVLDEGKLVQEGKHQELVKQSGQYQEMWKAQAQFYI